MSSFEEVIERLVQKREELIAQLARIEQAISALTSTADSFKGEIDIPSAELERRFALRPVSAEIIRSPTVVQPEEIAALARRTLLEVGRPLKRGPLVRAMEERKIPLTGKDKAKNLGTILWRHNNQFVNLEKYGYWPRDVKYRDVYDPTDPPDGIMYVSPDEA